MIIGRSWDTTGTRVCETGFTASGRWNASWTGGHAQAAKALAFWIPERPKAKAVGYLEAKTQPLVLHGYADADYLAGFRFLGGDPLGGAGVEHIERKCAAAEDFVVEGADVELGA